MNCCTRCRSTGTDVAGFDETFVQGVITDIENTYATEPMAIVKPQQMDEEEVYTSFEEAISDRLLALQPRLDRISQPLLDTGAYKTAVYTGIRNQGQIQKQTKALTITAWQRITIFACFALMFLLSGFDLMGLLVLHMH
jgi:hypothetical protein